MTIDEPIDPALEAALADAGDDAAPLVYGDWLAERGHPRGELIALQHAIAQAPDDDTLRERERWLFLMHGRALLPFAPGEGRELDWDRGFIRGARLYGHDADGALVQLLAHPSARFLRRLDVCVPDTHMIVDDLSEARPPLEWLSIFDEAPLAPEPFVWELAAVFPRIEDLAIEGTAISMTELPPRLRTLDAPLTEALADALGRCALPALAGLALSMGDVPAERLAAFFARADLPALRTIRFLDRDGRVGALAVEAPFAAQLERVEFRGTPSDIEALLRATFGDRFVA